MGGIVDDIWLTTLANWWLGRILRTKYWGSYSVTGIRFQILDGGGILVTTSPSLTRGSWPVGHLATGVEHLYNTVTPNCASVLQTQPQVSSPSREDITHLCLRLPWYNTSASDQLWWVRAGLKCRSIRRRPQVARCVSCDYQWRNTISGFNGWLDWMTSRGNLVEESWKGQCDWSFASSSPLTRTTQPIASPLPDF
jgi:hypothetical protein